MHQKIKVTLYNRPPRALRGSRGIALLILILGARRGWVVSTTSRPLYPWERPNVQEAGWAPGRKISPLPGFVFCTIVDLFDLFSCTSDRLFYFPFRRKACCEFFQPEKSDGFGRERTRYQRPARIRSPDRPARSQSLYRLIYPAYRVYTAFQSFIRDLTFCTDLSTVFGVLQINGRLG
jgi:hypothetical protein